MTVSTLKIAALALGASLLSLPALAQDYSAYGDDDTVTVEAPRPYHYTPPRSTIGAPIEDVAISAPVRTDDLDLTDGRDVYRLHARIFTTARHLCERLDNRFPVTYSDGSPSCYRRQWMTRWRRPTPRSIAPMATTDGETQAVASATT